LKSYKFLILLSILGNVKKFLVFKANLLEKKRAAGHTKTNKSFAITAILKTHKKGDWS
jgi:hypothetical protein